MNPGNRAPSGAQKRGGGFRIPRVEREIREVVGSYLLAGFRGELPGFVSITRVVASKDLRNAKVLITVMGEGSSREGCVNELQAHAHEIQQIVNQRLRMKHCPRLSFHYDTGYEHALKVEGILRDLEQEKLERADEDIDAVADSDDESPNDD